MKDPHAYAGKGSIAPKFPTGACRAAISRPWQTAAIIDAAQAYTPV